MTACQPLTAKTYDLYPSVMGKSQINDDLNQIMIWICPPLVPIFVVFLNF